MCNWGAYAITAMIGYLLEKPEVLQDEDTEYRMLDSCVMAGAVDSVANQLIINVDGIAIRGQQKLITLLHAFVENGLRLHRLKKGGDSEPQRMLHLRWRTYDTLSGMLAGGVNSSHAATMQCGDCPPRTGCALRTDGQSSLDCHCRVDRAVGHASVHSRSCPDGQVNEESTDDRRSAGQDEHAVD
jgi:hypothetical protein